MPKMVDLGRTKLIWVAGLAGIASPSAPTVAELTTGTAVDVSCIMKSNYSVGPTDSESTNERAVCETANNVTPTVQNYEGTLEVFRQLDASTGAAEVDDPLNIWEFGEVGWFVRRIGLPYSTAIAASQVLEVYLFMADTPRPNGGTGEGNLAATIKLLPQGSFDTKAVVAA